MKKIFAAIVSIVFATSVSMAQNQHAQKADHVHASVHEMHQQARPHHDPVVDMDLIQKLGLSDKKISQIEALQQRKQKDMIALRPNAPKPDQHPEVVRQPAQHKDPKMQAFVDSYRKELRNIMGTEKYLTYIEKQNDRLKAMRMGHNRHHRI